jgi:hypothetical protein
MEFWVVFRRDFEGVFAVRMPGLRPLLAGCEPDNGLFAGRGRAAPMAARSIIKCLIADAKRAAIAIRMVFRRAGAGAAAVVDCRR